MLRQNGREKMPPLRQLNAEIMYVMANFIQLNGMQRRFKTLIATAECWIVSRPNFGHKQRERKEEGVRERVRKNGAKLEGAFAAADAPFDHSMCRTSWSKVKILATAKCFNQARHYNLFGRTAASVSLCSCHFPYAAPTAPRTHCSDKYLLSNFVKSKWGARATTEAGVNASCVR